MKNFSLFTLIFSLAASAAAAVPQKWTVEASRVAPVAIDAYHGETLALEATFQSYGKPLEMPLNGCCILWQTNGMGSAWWQSPATVTSNRVSATFTPAMDPGAASVIGFIGATGQNYRAAFTLRFRHGPGGDPAVLPLPARAIDCATVTWQNPADAPFASKAAVEQKLDEQDATRLASTVITNHVTSGYLATVEYAVDAFAPYETVDGVNALCETQSLVVAGMDYLSEILPYDIDQEMFGIGVSYAMQSEYATCAGAITNNQIQIRDFYMNTMAGGPPNPNFYPGPYIGFKDKVHDLSSSLRPDGSPVATSNMVNGIVAPIEDTVAEQGDAIEGKADAASVSQLATSVSAIAAHLNAEDARFVTTNYDNAAMIPESYLEIKVSNEWLRVWSEMARWNRFAGTNFNWQAWSGFDGWKSNVEAEIDDKAYKCWGMYDSETGDVSPDGFTQISSSNIVIASGMGYQRTLTTGGAVWVLQCNSGTATLGVDTNGYFRVMDGLGETQFEIIQGNRRELPGNAGGVEVLGPQSVRITYSIVCEEPPTLWICDDLTTHDWKASTNDSCIATATWSGSSSNYVATVTAKSPSTTKMFVTATYWSGGETVINNVAPVKMEYIYIDNKKYKIGAATIGDKTVMTLEAQ